MKGYMWLSLGYFRVELKGKLMLTMDSKFGYVLNMTKIMKKEL